MKEIKKNAYIVKPVLSSHSMEIQKWLFNRGAVCQKPFDKLARTAF
jgi:hypothetical protein